VILRDTHAPLWMASDPKRVSRRTRKAICNARQGTGIAVATITLLEIAWMAHHKRILAGGSVEPFVRETVARVILKPVTRKSRLSPYGCPNRFPEIRPTA
jgi:PIN domain nuclease of toxin-antitoxin system